MMQQKVLLLLINPFCYWSHISNIKGVMGQLMIMLGQSSSSYHKTDFIIKFKSTFTQTDKGLILKF